MKVETIQTFTNPKVTGYTAASALCLTTISGLSKNKLIRKSHKPLAWASSVLTLIHIGLIEYYYLKYKNNLNKTQ